MATPIGPTSRRNFLKFAGAAGACAWAGAGLTQRAARGAATSPSGQAPQLALASYTLRKFDLDQTIAMTQRVGLGAICLKSFHLPLEATPAEIAAAAEKVKQSGLVLYGGGVIGMKREDQVNQAFEYAKAAGMIRIVAAPSEETLPLIDKKVQEYDIQVCIHNHGPGDKVFPTPDVAYAKIKDFDPRLGLCHDIGHTLRYGADPIALTEQCADRMYDVHIKDVTAAAKEGRSCPCGRGVLDLPAMLRALIKTGYTGYLAFEYEEEPNDPLPGLAESVGYIRGVMDAL